MRQQGYAPAHQRAAQLGLVEESVDSKFHGPIFIRYSAIT
jgi:hypothetical protein